MTGVEEWLDAHGLGGHAEAFRRDGVTLDLLGDLTEADLKELGLGVGDRKRFFRAVAELEDAKGPEPRKPDDHAPHAERRRLTIMFVDLVGSTRISSAMDPEEWSDVLRDYQAVVSDVVARFDGHVAQYLGDGVLCFFGWPQAMEDAAERAAETALEIQAAMERFDAGGRRLDCRIGIATGLVVVGELIGRSDNSENTAIGQTLNLAARLQSSAKAGQIVISEATRALLGNAFILEPLGERRLKGIPGPQAVHAVIRDNPDHERFAARAGLTTGEMIGRDAEFALLRDRWGRAAGGAGQMVCLTGEAGIGKSRICQALLQSLGDEAHWRIGFQCSPYLRDTALWPVISRITADSGVLAADGAEARLDKLEAYLTRDAPPDRERFALIADLLRLDYEPRYGPITLAPAARRAATFSALLEHLVAISRRDPLLAMFEDLHWADPSTLELVEAVVERMREERVLILVTRRPDGALRFNGRPHVTEIPLGRLGRSGVAEIVARLGGGRLPPETIEAIIERTDGVPLFVEELTKAMIESGDMRVPANLHDTLMARLDRKPELKEAAQVASVFGRDFDAGLAARVAGTTREDLDRALDGLRLAELIFPAGGAGRFTFKHALVRDAAYESLLIRRRQELHGRILDVLAEDAGAVPAVLAQHAAEAGRLPEAVAHGRRAAEQALGRPAYAEAIAHAENALAALARMNPAEAPAEERKRLLLLAGQARIAHLGYAAEATTATYAEIERIARETGDDALLIDGLYGKWAGLYVPGRLPAALGIADAICEAGATAEDDLARALGHRLCGTVLTMMGEIDAATEALAAAAQSYDPDRHARFASRFGQDVGIAGKCYRIGVLTLAGRLDAAAGLAHEVLGDVERLGHPHTTGYALGHLAVLLSAAGIHPLGEEIARDCVAASARNRTPLWTALGRASLALAHVQEGDAAAAAPELREAIETLDGLDFTVFSSLLLPAFASSLVEAGDIAGAEAQLAAAARLAEEHEARFHEAEILRIEGRLLLRKGARAEAEARFGEAMTLAASRGHLTWRLRAADDLAALMRASGRAEEGRRLLAEALAMFEETGDYPIFRRVAGLAGGARSG